MNATIKRAPGGIGGTITAPPSKSMAHRAVLCSALAEGASHIENLEFSKDISATLSAAGQLCAKVRTGADRAVVEGLGSFLPVSAPVDCCESGSTLRFLIPIASLTGQKVTFVGRGRLMERPQTVYEKLYQEQSLRFEQSSAGLTVEGTLKSSEYELAGNVSSQFISGLLFALPLLAGDSTLHLIPPVESRSYIEMTRAAQRRFGVESRWQDENTLFIPGGQKYRPCDYTVEGDYSQAAFPAVLGAVQGGVTLKGLSADTLQGDAAILDILRRCGASFRTTDAGIVFEKAPLHGVDIDLADCPDLGPVLMVLGLLCEGTTTIRNAETSPYQGERPHCSHGSRTAGLRRRPRERGRHHHHPRLCRQAPRPRRTAPWPQRPPCGDEPCGAGAGRRTGTLHRRRRGRAEELAPFL